MEEFELEENGIEKERDDTLLRGTILKNILIEIGT